MARKQQTEYESLAEAIDGMLETVRAIVASLINDGFTDEQARIIATGILGRIPNTTGEDT